ncbi:MAG: PAS domain S-box protein [Bacteroidales bacterium]|nr:PAS domain S-box protein [Bacteroidales bacterium]MCF8404680.1 PAS domain S-box protein [Bacteroidales bacterium]
MNKQKPNQIFDEDVQIDIFNALSSPLIVCNTSGIIIQWNEAAIKLFKWESSQVAGKNVKLIFPGINLTQIFSGKKGLIKPIFLDAVDKRGKLLETKITAKQIISTAGDGKPLFLISINISKDTYPETKIKERNKIIIEQNKKLIYQSERLKRQDQEIAQNNALLSELNRILLSEKQKSKHYLDIAGVMFIALNRAGQVTMANAKTCEVLGFDQQEILGKDWFEHFIPGHSKHKTKKAFYNLMEGNADNIEYFVNHAYTKKGEERLIAWHNSVLTSDSGEVVGLLSSGEDITEKTKAEEALRQSEEKYKAIVENSYDGIYIYQNDKFIFVNNKVHELSGYSREDIQNANIWDLIHPDDRERIYQYGQQRVVGAGSPNNYEARVICKDGTTKDCEFTVKALNLDIGFAVIGVVRDISERKKTELELSKYRDQLEQLVKERTKELEEKNKELEKFNNLFIGREFRIKELRERIKKLEDQ